MLIAMRVYSHVYVNVISNNQNTAAEKVIIILKVLRENEDNILKVSNGDCGLSGAGQAV